MCGWGPKNAGSTCGTIGEFCIFSGFLLDIACDTVSRIHITLMLSKSPIGISPCQVMQLAIQYFGWTREKRTSLEVSTARESGCSLTCSHFPLWEKLWAKKISLSSKLYHLERGMMWIKPNCSSYLFQSIQTCNFFLMVCWNVSIRNSNFHKGSLVYGWLFKIVFQWFLECGCERLEPVHRPLNNTQD